MIIANECGCYLAREICYRFERTLKGSFTEQGRLYVGTSKQTFVHWISGTIQQFACGHCLVIRFGNYRAARRWRWLNMYPWAEMSQRITLILLFSLTTKLFFYICLKFAKPALTFLTRAPMSILLPPSGEFCLPRYWKLSTYSTVQASYRKAGRVCRVYI